MKLFEFDYQDGYIFIFVIAEEESEDIQIAIEYIDEGELDKDDFNSIGILDLTENAEKGVFEFIKTK